VHIEYPTDNIYGLRNGVSSIMRSFNLVVNSISWRVRQSAIRSVVFLLAACMSASCDACGFPNFVKITPDSRYIIYQDAWYPKAYVYDTASKAKIVYDGHFTCMDAAASRVILRGPVADGLMPCWIVEFGPDGPTRTSLPPVPMGDCRDGRIIIDDDERGFIAALMEYKWSTEPLRAMRLDSGAEQWVDLPAVPQPAEGGWQHDEPYRDRHTRHLYTHTPSWPLIHDDLDSHKGVDVESFYENDKLGYKLTSPDGSYFVTIIDPRDIWRRMWLTDVATGERTMLLDKNNAGQELFMRIAGFPGGLLLTLFGVSF